MPPSSQAAQYGNMDGAHPDPLERLTTVLQPIGATVFSYLSNSVTTTKSIEGGLQSVVTESVDGLGRPGQTTQYDTYQGAGSQSIMTRTYDALGRLHTISNPGRGAAGPVTTLSYDELDRPTGTVYPDNSVATTCYSNNEAVTRDPAGKFRKSVTDALGRLTQAVDKGQLNGREADA